MIRISLLILLVFLLARVVSGVVQRYQDKHAAGASFKKMLRQGRLDAGVYEDAVWSEVGTGRRKHLRSRVSREQQRVIRAARLQMREDFLDDSAPGFYQYIILFLVASVLGLVLETVYTLVTFGILESRVGLVWGPFSPLYGVGAVVLTMVLWPLRKRPAWQLFLLSAALGGTLEQVAGWSMEHFAHLQSWTYLGLPDHITQWVAWRFLVMWGLLGVVWCRVIMPEMIYRIGEPTSRRQKVVVALLTAFISLDIVMTVACFWRAGQRVEGIPPRNPFEAYVDTHFNDSFMERTFENMKIGEDLPVSDK
ncbi:putative ABC transporter permease [Collinsella sp. An2]|uniref:putative ABC transporter permease n=1 Tax=Collinsella sp. An2 TaxID=1965585 RepID=UPI000B370786|nr:putative ABC transporter permease [Collinsella sp. An2]OUP08019.1 hypothetical protein B5F33_07770 [Collinsella sp. An2]